MATLFFRGFLESSSEPYEHNIYFYNYIAINITILLSELSS